MSMIPPAVNTEEETRNYNLPLYGIRGEFSISQGVTVPYFMSLMDLKRVTRELKTHEEVSPSLDTVYNLVELFQRKIDDERVEREIIDGYLRVPNKLKFFNSLTIVLLPKSPEGHICQSFDNYPNNNPAIPAPQTSDFDTFFADSSWNRSVFGGVQFVSTTTANLARLRWDSNRVDAVAVDGQHRLRALKLWMQKKHNELTETEKPTRIPIIFLLLHEAVGFRVSQGIQHSGIKTIAREIFTDLNKNAREVDLATQIILDDRSIESCCVRSLVTDSTCTDDETLLPLSLLRWQEANNRFDQKYFLNSLVNLHLIVKDILDLEPPKDPMSKTQATNFIAKASNLLGLGEPPRILDREIDLQQFYREEFLDDEGEPIAPFTGIPTQFLKAAVEGFKQRFSTWLLRLLTEFKPYAEIISYARLNDLITGEFAQFLSQPKSHQSQLEIELAARHGDGWRQSVILRHEQEIERIKGLRDKEKGEQWAFKTIFQKAFIRLGKLLFVETPEGDKERFGTTDDLLEFFNRLYEHDVLRIYAPLAGKSYDLWTFISVNYGNRKIQVVSKSETRIKSILTLWYFGWRYAKHHNKALSLEQDNDYCVSTKSILAKFGTKATQVSWPTVNDSYTELFDNFKKNASIIDNRGDEMDIDDAERRKIAQRRLLAVFNEGLRPWLAVSEAKELEEISI